MAEHRYVLGPGREDAHAHSATARSAKDGTRAHDVIDSRRACALERLHEPVARKFVAPKCERRVEVRGMVEAAPAHRRGGTGKRAPGAGFGKRGQLGDASRAKQLPTAFLPA